MQHEEFQKDVSGVSDVLCTAIDASPELNSSDRLIAKTLVHFGASVFTRFNDAVAALENIADRMGSR